MAAHSPDPAWSPERVEGRKEMFDILTDVVLTGYHTLSETQQLMLLAAVGGEKAMSWRTIETFFQGRA